VSPACIRHFWLHGYRHHRPGFSCVFAVSHHVPHHAARSPLRGARPVLYRPGYLRQSMGGLPSRPPCQRACGWRMMGACSSRSRDGPGVPGSLVGDVKVVDRKRQTVPVLPRWVTLFGVLAFVATVLGLVVLLDVRYQRAVGQEFLDAGVATVADHVEVVVRYGKGGSFIDEVEVTFSIGPERRVATLSNSLGDPEGNAAGRHPPATGTRYAAPLQILYKPGDPSQVIALADAESFAGDTQTESYLAGAVAIGSTATIAIVVGWLACLRLRSGKAKRSGAPGNSRRRRGHTEVGGRHRRVDG
jgi:hypothetical protein